MNTKVDGAMNIEVSDEELLVRLTGRRVCKTCGQSFHVKFQPPKQEGVCDACGGPLYQRDDDSLETAKNRLTVYKAQTEPLINYYKNEDVLFDIHRAQDVANVFPDLVAVIGSVSK
jgi:adenylate kinase